MARLRPDVQRVVVRFPTEEIFSSPKRPDRFWGPPSFLFNGDLSSFSGESGAGHEAVHSRPYSAEVKNEWNYIPLSIRLHGVHTNSSTVSVTDMTCSLTVAA